ncbi:MAG TPA: histidine kinase [Chloroflexota bacterium]|nr:histidine kinase [Chloroflexota bacterium]
MVGSQRSLDEEEAAVSREMISLASEILSIDEACQTVLTLFARIFPCVGSWMATTRTPDGAPQLRATSGFSWIGEADLSALSPQRLTEIHSARTGLWVIDIEHFPTALPFVDEDVGAVVIAKLSAHNCCVGIVTLMLPTQWSFTPHQRQLLASLATQAALVVHNANLVAAAQELVIQEERSRIATEIHDGVSQNLALLMLKVEIISRLIDMDPQRAKAELEKLQSIVELSVQELRRSINTLRSPDSAGLGLMPAIQRVVTDFTRQTGMEVELALPSEVSLPPQAISTILGVIQERLATVSKQASASRVAVEVETACHLLTMRVADDGHTSLHPPFDENAATPPLLDKLRDLVRPIGGTVSTTADLTGMVVESRIPLRQCMTPSH